MSNPDGPAAEQLALTRRYQTMLSSGGSSGSVAVHELTPEYLLWMTETMISHGPQWPADKLGRWLGFVQAGCVLNGLTTVKAERDYSRSMMHAAYARQGLEPPATREGPQPQAKPGQEDWHRRLLRRLTRLW